METADLTAVQAQLGREARGETEVVSRCHLGLPVVVRVGPILEDGTPFPTLYWLTCPLARARVSRLESEGGVRHYAAMAQQDPGFARELELAHREYELERDALMHATTARAPRGGVGGVREHRSVKCLHAHVAHTLVGRRNPIGARVLSAIEPFDCEMPCVLGDASNPDWREPAGARVKGVQICE